MKALCIKQPYASLIANGQKTIEIRSWSTSYRGPILILVSARPVIDNLPTSQAIAIANIIDCRSSDLERDAKNACHDKITSNHFSWILDNVRLIPPFPTKGRLGLFEIPY